jgi:hypothetical protein
MRIGEFVLLAVIVTLAACSGGGAGGSSPAAPSGVVPSNGGSAATGASGTLSIALNAASATTSSTKRSPAYVSPGTTFATLFIDGATTGQRQACNATTPCTFNWTSTSGQHTFAIETDSSPSIAGGGSILSEGQQTYTLNPGTNALGTLTLDGVPGQEIFENEALVSAVNPNCATGALGECYVGTYGIADEQGNIIKPPGNLTVAPVPAPSSPSANSVETDFPTVPTAPDANGTDYVFSVSCLLLGNFAVSIQADIYGPPFVLSPYIVAAQRTAYNLQAPTLIPVNWPQYECENGTPSASGPSSGTVTVQGITR